MSRCCAEVMEEKLSKVNIEVGVCPTSTGKLGSEFLAYLGSGSVRLVLLPQLRFRCYNAEELEDVISRLWGCSGSEKLLRIQRVPSSWL